MVKAPDAISDALHSTEAWFDANGWTVFDFQRQTWQAWHAGHSGLIHSPTGSGKTLAAWLGPVQQARLSPPSGAALQVLWITPLRALANDTRQNLQTAADALTGDIEVAVRSGDTSTRDRRRQTASPPFCLVTTPESLSLMLAERDHPHRFAALHTVVVDEWHELLGSKRGVLLQLSLARLRAICPGLRIWGLSATLANLDEAAEVLLGRSGTARLIKGETPREVVIDSLLPPHETAFPWAGHLGLALRDAVVAELEPPGTTLLFTNTRSQAELWFKALLEARPDWLHELALHHGSIDKHLRIDIEDRLRSGELRCVVCTSSLDLGVDFSPVDRVMQIGSPKGVARLLQRAGRSGHRPGSVSRILCVPANTFELVEISAVREAAKAGRIEARTPPRLCLDVLSQHLVTLALGAGFVAGPMKDEVRATHAFEALEDREWDWVMDFITRGGQALQGYPAFHKVVEVAGVYRVMNAEIARRHRMAIGTITSDTQMSVVLGRGTRLGTIEESFIARLSPGDVFHFSGRQLELVRVREMSAIVRTANRRSRTIPKWQGTQMPLSTELADSVLATLQHWREGTLASPELAAIDRHLALQRDWSHLPGPGDFLIESCETDMGHSLILYPFAGRLAHEGLAMLVAARLTRDTALTLTITVNDYGFELQSPTPFSPSDEALRQALSTERLLEDILQAVNSAELSRRLFRDIARIAGLVFDGYPGRAKSSRQIQASSALVYDVLRDFDADNLLLAQADREVLASQLEFTRIEATLARIANRRWVRCRVARLTPLGFPLWAESLQAQTISSEPPQQRIERMLDALEQAIGGDTHDTTAAS